MRDRQNFTLRLSDEERSELDAAASLYRGTTADFIRRTALRGARAAITRANGSRADSGPGATAAAKAVQEAQAAGVDTARRS